MTIAVIMDMIEMTIKIKMTLPEHETEVGSPGEAEHSACAS